MDILGYVGFTFDFFVALLTIMGTFRILGIITVLLATFVYYLESCACPMPSDGGQPQLDFPSSLNNTVLLGTIKVLLATFVYYLVSGACPMPSNGLSWTSPEVSLIPAIIS